MVSKAERLQKQYEESIAKAKAAKAELEQLRRKQDRQAKIAARKARNQALFRAGELVEIAELLQLDAGTLLGGLLHIANTLQKTPDSPMIQDWKNQGDTLLQARENSRKNPPKKSTPAEPTVELSDADFMGDS
ncbi:MAG: conjugal transfer protein TraD [Synergistaceae bacterium]